MDKKKSKSKLKNDFQIIDLYIYFSFLFYYNFFYSNNVF